jgi:hypothetical protein
MKVLVHDGIGVWLAARRLNQGKFVWPAKAGDTAAEPRATRRPGAGPALAAHRRGRRHHGAVEPRNSIANVPMRRPHALGTITCRDRPNSNSTHA